MTSGYFWIAEYVSIPADARETGRTLAPRKRERRAGWLTPPPRDRAVHYSRSARLKIVLMYVSA